MKRSLILITLSIILVFILSMSIYAATWEILGEGKDGTVHYYDKDSVQYLPGNIVKFWQKLIPSEKSKNDDVEKFGIKNRDYNINKTLFEMNCSTNEIRVLHMIYYDSKEDIIESSNFTSRWDPIVPESVAEHIFKKLCPQKKKK